MHLNFYTLRALAAEWNEEWAGSRIGESYSQSRDELSLVLYRDDVACTLRCRLAGPFRYVFRSHGTGRARRNVVSLFESTLECEIAAIETANRDRHLFFRLRDGRALQFTLFGSASNVYLVESNGLLIESFRSRNRSQGELPPPVVPAEQVGDCDAFLSRWKEDARTAGDALRRAVPLFDRQLACEALLRANVDPSQPARLSLEELSRVWECVGSLERDLHAPHPRIYARDATRLAFSLVPLIEFRDWTSEPFETVDAAAAAFVRRSLSIRALLDRVEPLMKGLRRYRDRAASSLARMQQELLSESRADQYERWGHLLMANPSTIPDGAEKAELTDLFNPDITASIPLDPALSAIQNAERYYERARKAREARQHAARRAHRVEKNVSELDQAILMLDATTDADGLAAFEEKFASLIQQAEADPVAAGRLPFRRYELSDGYEAWVGRNARQNDELTFRRAAKNDLWLHARDAAGSHVIVRLPHRDSVVPKRVIEKAAQIAAYFSSASGSSLVPVTVTQRKYVRKMKAGPPGAVIVEREEVVIVPPGRPADAP